MDRHDWDARYSGDELIWTAEPNRFLVAEAGDLPPGRVLDVACGEGRNAVWLAERGWRATGVDFSAAGIAKARRLAAARGVEVRWETADVTEHAPEAGAYDLVIVLYLQLPPDARVAAFTRAASAVAPGGTLLVVAHDSTNLADGYGGPRDPAVLYSPDDVTPLLDGFDVVKAERVQRPVRTDDGERVAIDALVRAVRRAT